MKTCQKGLAGHRPGTFIKGDQRINKNGPVSKDRSAWAAEFNNLLATKADPNKIIDKLVSLAEKGVEWAMKEVLDRLMGKSAQPINLLSENMVYNIVHREPKTTK